jgi:hypothetical protein
MHVHRKKLSFGRIARGKNLLLLLRCVFPLVPFRPSSFIGHRIFFILPCADKQSGDAEAARDIGDGVSFLSESNGLFSETDGIGFFHEKWGKEKGAILP